MSNYNKRQFSSFTVFEKRERKPWQRDQQKLNEIELTDDFFKNDNGCYRWQNIRLAYFNNFIDMSRVVNLYNKWRDQKEYLWLEIVNTKTEEVMGDLFFKCAKRGNDVYKNRLKHKFSFLDSLNPIYFFLGDSKVKYTPMLFVSLTVDPKLYPNIDLAWLDISQNLHVFETKLRQKYGSFVKFRVWDAHESGYPHCHIVYYFHDKWFKAISHRRKKDNKLIYIIPTVHKNSIAKMWGMGNVDVQAVQDTHGAFNEVKKYITKNIWSDKGHLTNAMICLHRKQMYSLSLCDPYKQQIKYMRLNNHKISVNDLSRYTMLNLPKWAKKDFIGSIWGTQLYYQFYKERGDLAEPNTTALVREFVHNCNIDDVKFRYVGCVSYADMQNYMPNLNDDWIICSDPPPEFKLLMNLGRDELAFARV